MRVRCALDGLASVLAGLVFNVDSELLADDDELVVLAFGGAAVVASAGEPDTFPYELLLIPAPPSTARSRKKPSSFCVQ